ncbi:MAG TPA: twin-arginine translocase TatA/TatE family subunit [Anaeromyxobacteraceae bacterium]|jgi:sec-independent protein translocase protein TatA|nr:twin-arginine translocase TatA/TatE family subunit [Anaeromyxobacteraceae bacterium]
MGLRLPELLIILVVLLLVFGANKIPQLGDALGKGIRNFKKSSNEGEDAVDVTPKEQGQLAEKAPTRAASTAASAEKKA